MNLAYTDLIGQPTWVGTNECFFSTVLRADLIPTKIVSFPATIFGVDLEAAGYDNAQVVSSLYPSLLTFSGTVWLHKVRHVGDSRSADGAAWRTDCWAFISGSQEAVQASADISGAVSGAAAAVTSGTNAPNVNLQGVDRQRQRFASRRMRQW